MRWTGDDLRIKQRRVVASREYQETEPEDRLDDQKDGLMEEDLGTENGPEDITSHQDIRIASHNSWSVAIHIDFSITLSPTYSVPILWLTSPALRSIDHVHEALLSQHLEAPVRSIGVMGGTSQAVCPRHLSFAETRLTSVRSTIQ